MSKTQTFLAGSKWAHGNFNQNACETVDYFMKRSEEKQLTKREADKLETAINSFALEIIRFSKTEWANDYYSNVHELRKLSEWLRRYEKFHGFGEDFMLFDENNWSI